MFHRFLVFFKASRKFALGFPDISLVTIFARDRVDGATGLIFRYWIFRFRKQIPDGLVWLFSNFDVMISQNDHLAQILMNNTDLTVKNSMEFCGQMKNVKLEEGDELLSFDVVSLFTSIPVDLAIQVATDVLSNDETLQDRSTIPVDISKDCDKSYIGETKRKFSTRLKEHQKAVEHKHSQKSALAEYCLRSDHTVSWEASKILRTSANWRNRRILEA